MRKSIWWHEFSYPSSANLPIVLSFLGLEILVTGSIPFRILYSSAPMVCQYVDKAVHVFGVWKGRISRVTLHRKYI